MTNSQSDFALLDLITDVLCTEKAMKQEQGDNKTFNQISFITQRSMTKTKLKSLLLKLIPDLDIDSRGIKVITLLKQTANKKSLTHNYRTGSKSGVKGSKKFLVKCRNYMALQNYFIHNTPKEIKLGEQND